MTKDTNEWQPIETAPTNVVVDLWIESSAPDTDHSMVKFYSPDARPIEKGNPMLHGRMTDAIQKIRLPNKPGWFPSAGLMPALPLSPDVKATHWMRRPAPPKRS